MAEILIKNMKMPKDCYDCPLIIENKEKNGFYDCILIGKACALSTIHKDCPLVELPPHGRLCDIDRMISESRKVQYSVSIQSADELADFLEIYADLDKSPYDNTVVVPASKGE